MLQNCGKHPSWNLISTYGTERRTLGPTACVLWVGRPQEEGVAPLTGESECTGGGPSSGAPGQRR